MQTRFVILLTGDSTELYLQAHAACLGLIAHGPEGSEIVVVTNRPERFRWLATRVHVETLDDDELRAWRGPHDYFFRAKFRAVQRAAERGPAHLVLLDADVLVRRPLAGLVADLDAGRSVMHVVEKPLGARKGTRVQLQAAFGHSFAGVPLSEQTLVLNSGVVGIPGTQRALVDRALELNDALLDAGLRYFAIEQVAWSAVIGPTQPVLAAPYIDHYWGNKRAFQQRINAFLAESLANAWTPEQAASELAARPVDLPLRVKDRWWHAPVRRMLRLPTA